MVGTSRAGGQGVEVRLLGPLQALKDGRPVPLGGAKPRALIAALALEPGRVVSVDRLVEDLWPGEPPETAAHALQVYVSQIRKALGSAAISTRTPGYALELDTDCVDVGRFVRLAEAGRAELHAANFAIAESALRDALALWRGAALADFLYEPFAQTEIARLEDLRLVTLEERIEAGLALGRHVELVSELDALVDAHPLRERPCAQLMLALYRSGRQPDALAAYRRVRETLVEELGIEPKRELKELEAAILRQDESLLPDVAATVPAMEFRRLVTILFADVVESMALAEALDAEAVAEILRRYFDTVSAALTRHGGTVEKFAGDAVMAVFGIPVSHEDDALRAARAAFDIRAGLASLNERLVHEHGVGLEVRIGIETGEVVATRGDSRQRFVTGEVVGIAARLEQAAAAGEIIVGELAGRLIDHAAGLEALGDLDVKGKREPVRAYRLLTLASTAPPFERRQDGPFVGRKRERAVLRRALKRVTEGATARAIVVVGPPGIGKSRLAEEIAGRTKGATSLFGRCLSYGDGITYWPLREVLQKAPQSAELDAILAALDADTPPTAAELALAFRRFCETTAREEPLMLVFDDVHWGEPTFLDLVEYVAEKSEAPMLIVCLAREELLEDHPTFLADAERIVLDALSAKETDALLDALGGAALETDQRDRIADAADGNPLFLEQLLALVLEGGVERAVPATVQALLAARLDRLGPGERAVLERGSVVGKEFTSADIASLLEPDVAHTADAHLDALAGRGFVRPRREGGFRFRHVLVQDAVYRAAPKRLRAELHERFADNLDDRLADLAELDEFVGYHLEQAHRLRKELRKADARTRELAEEAGRRLGAAGLRALRRGDIHAATNLLVRATSLLPTDHQLRRELLCELGLVRVAAHDSDGAIEVLTEAIAESREAGDRRVEWRARLELEYIQLRREAKRTANELLDATAEGIPIFERADDRRALGRAWLLAGFVHGGHRGNHKAWEEAAERALGHYKAAGWPTSTCVGEVAAALYWGPTPVEDAIRRCELFLQDEALDLPGAAYLRAFLGGLVAQHHDFDRARARVGSARTTLEDLGMRAAAETYCTPLLGEIELLAGDPAASERILRELCEQLERAKDFSHLASRASDLAEALVEQGLLEEADEWTHVAERHAATDDLNAQMMWRPVRARIHARRDEFGIAERLAREAVALADSTDDLNRRAKAQRDLGEVLRLAGNGSDAAFAFERALEIYEQKGNLVGVTQVRSLQEQLAIA
jgi:class 3 adenylate cyclase/tetratricopeptide (TPR) repeat protein